MTTNTSYKADIDGLRGIAVLLVLFYHAGFDTLNGGFIGVDVFFVISGFLITGIITRALENNTFKFSEFYLRRCRRLAPSFIVVLIFTWLAGFFLYSAEQYMELGKTSVAALFFFSNWYFASQSNYFDSDLESNPLLHTWSLSVEEQFYLVWPLFLVGLHFLFKSKNRPKLHSIAGITLVGLLLSVYMVDLGEFTNPFFNTLTRIWEFSIGACLSLLFNTRSNSAPTPGATSTSTSFLQTLQYHYANSLRIFGLVLIAVSAVSYEDNFAFPGIASALPVFGATAILLASPYQHGCGYRMLAAWPLRFIGKISYSLYLWHWPVLVFGREIWPNPHLLITLLLLIISAGLATLTTFFIENPIRYQRRITGVLSFWLFMITSTTVLTSLGIFLVQSDGIPQRWEYEHINLKAIDYRFCEGFGCGGCFIDDRHTVSMLLEKKCLVPKPGGNNVLIVGDSFAAQLMPGLKHHYPDIHFNQATASACRALLDFGKDSKNTKWPCPELNRIVFNSVIPNTRYDAIILASDWQSWRNGGDANKLADTVAYIQQNNSASVIVLGNTPVYKTPTDVGLRRHTVTGHRLFHELEFRDKLLNTEAENHEKLSPDVFISLLDSFCNNGSCPIVSKDGNMIHFGSHLTSWGAIGVIGAAKSEIDEVFNGFLSSDTD